MNPRFRVYCSDDWGPFNLLPGWVYQSGASPVTYLHSGLAAGHIYTYKIVSYNANNLADLGTNLNGVSVSSSYSAQTKLAMPTLTVFGYSSTEIRAEWTSVHGASKYILMWKPLGGTDTPVDPATSVYQHTGLPPNSQYLYSINAIGPPNFNASGYSGWQSAWTKPSGASGLTLTPACSNNMQIQWTNPANGAADRVLLQYKTPSDSSFSTLLDLPNPFSLSSYTHTFLRQNVQYTYRVIARNTQHDVIVTADAKVNGPPSIPYWSTGVTTSGGYPSISGTINPPANGNPNMDRVTLLAASDADNFAKLYDHGSKFDWTSGSISFLDTAAIDLAPPTAPSDVTPTGGNNYTGGDITVSWSPSTDTGTDYAFGFEARTTGCLIASDALATDRGFEEFQTGVSLPSTPATPLTYWTTSTPGGSSVVTEIRNGFAGSHALRLYGAASGGVPVKAFYDIRGLVNNYKLNHSNMLKFYVSAYVRGVGQPTIRIESTASDLHPDLEAESYPEDNGWGLVFWGQTWTEYFEYTWDSDRGNVLHVAPYLYGEEGDTGIILGDGAANAWNDNGSPWNNTQHKNISMWVKSGNSGDTFIPRVSVSTQDSGGVVHERHLYYPTNSSASPSVSGDLLNFPIGALGYDDGDWHQLSLNLQTDLVSLLPGETVTAVNGLVIYAYVELYVDDIVLSGGAAITNASATMALNDRHTSTTWQKVGFYVDANGISDSTASIVLDNARSDGQSTATVFWDDVSILPLKSYNNTAGIKHYNVVLTKLDSSPEPIVDAFYYATTTSLNTINYSPTMTDQGRLYAWVQAVDGSANGGNRSDWVKAAGYWDYDNQPPNRAATLDKVWSDAARDKDRYIQRNIKAMGVCPADGREPASVRIDLFSDYSVSPIGSVVLNADQTTYTISTSLTGYPDGEYSFYVRVSDKVDSGGNLGPSSGVVTRMLDTAPPSFSGLVRAEPDSSGDLNKIDQARLHWLSAADPANRTAPQNIIYDVHATTGSALNWTSDYYSTYTGSQFDLPTTCVLNVANLNRDATYHFAVRAMDLAGNQAAALTTRTIYGHNRFNFTWNIQANNWQTSLTTTFQPIHGTSAQAQMKVSGASIVKLVGITQDWRPFSSSLLQIFMLPTGVSDKLIFAQLRDNEGNYSFLQDLRGTFIEPAIPIKWDLVDRATSKTLTIGTRVMTSGQSMRAAIAATDQYQHSMMLTPEDVEMTLTHTVTPVIGLTGAPSLYNIVGQRIGSAVMTVKPPQDGLVGPLQALFEVDGPGPLNAIDIEGPPIVASGEIKNYTAKGRDAAGNPIAISPTWGASGIGTMTQLGNLWAAQTQDLISGTVKATDYVHPGEAGNPVSGSLAVMVDGRAPLVQWVNIFPTTGGLQNYSSETMSVPLLEKEQTLTIDLPTTPAMLEGSVPAIYEIYIDRKLVGTLRQTEAGAAALSDVVKFNPLQWRSGIHVLKVVTTDGLKNTNAAQPHEQTFVTTGGASPLSATDWLLEKINLDPLKPEQWGSWSYDGYQPLGPPTGDNLHPEEREAAAVQEVSESILTLLDFDPDYVSFNNNMSSGGRVSVRQAINAALTYLYTSLLDSRAGDRLSRMYAIQALIAARNRGYLPSYIDRNWNGSDGVRLTSAGGIFNKKVLKSTDQLINEFINTELVQRDDGGLAAGQEQLSGTAATFMAIRLALDMERYDLIDDYLYEPDGPYNIGDFLRQRYMTNGAGAPLPSASTGGWSLNQWDQWNAARSVFVSAEVLKSAARLRREMGIANEWDAIADQAHDFLMLRVVPSGTGRGFGDMSPQTNGQLTTAPVVLTASALLALHEAKQIDSSTSPSLLQGVSYLRASQRTDHSWNDRALDTALAMRILRPDLTIETIGAPTLELASGHFSYDVTIRNKGVEVAASFVLGAYNADPRNLSAQDREKHKIGQSGYAFNVGAGAEKNVSVTVTEVVETIYFMVDSMEGVPELDETNNFKSVLRQGKCDLSIAKQDLKFGVNEGIELVTGKPLIHGQAWVIAGKYRNVGAKASAGGTGALRVYLGDFRLNPEAHEIAPAKTLVGLDSGGASEFDFPIAANDPYFPLPGTYTISLVIEPGNNDDVTDENNIAVTTLQLLSVEEPDLPDLVIDPSHGISVTQRSAIAGLPAEFIVRVHVENRGNAPSIIPTVRKTADDRFEEINRTPSSGPTTGGILEPGASIEYTFEVGILPPGSLLRFEVDPVSTTNPRGEVLESDEFNNTHDAGIAVPPLDTYDLAVFSDDIRVYQGTDNVWRLEAKIRNVGDTAYDGNALDPIPLTVATWDSKGVLKPVPVPLAMPFAININEFYLATWMITDASWIDQVDDNIIRIQLIDVPAGSALNDAAEFRYRPPLAGRIGVKNLEVMDLEESIGYLPDCGASALPVTVQFDIYTTSTAPLTNVPIELRDRAHDDQLLWSTTIARLNESTHARLTITATVPLGTGQHVLQVHLDPNNSTREPEAARDDNLSERRLVAVRPPEGCIPQKPDLFFTTETAKVHIDGNFVTAFGRISNALPGTTPDAAGPFEISAKLVTSPAGPDIPLGSRRFSGLEANREVIFNISTSTLIQDGELTQEGDLVLRIDPLDEVEETEVFGELNNITTLTLLNVPSPINVQATSYLRTIVLTWENNPLLAHSAFYRIQRYRPGLPVETFIATPDNCRLIDSGLGGNQTGFNANETVTYKIATVLNAGGAESPRVERTTVTAPRPIISVTLVSDGTTVANNEQISSTRQQDNRINVTVTAPQAQTVRLYVQGSWHTLVPVEESDDFELAENAYLKTGRNTLIATTEATYNDGLSNKTVKGFPSLPFYINYTTGVDLGISKDEVKLEFFMFDHPALFMQQWWKVTPKIFPNLHVDTPVRPSVRVYNSETRPSGHFKVRFAWETVQFNQGEASKQERAPYHDGTYPSNYVGTYPPGSLVPIYERDVANLSGGSFIDVGFDTDQAIAKYYRIPKDRVIRALKVFVDSGNEVAETLESNNHVTIELNNCYTNNDVLFLIDMSKEWARTSDGTTTPLLLNKALDELKRILKEEMISESEAPNGTGFNQVAIATFNEDANTNYTLIKPYRLFTGIPGETGLADPTNPFFDPGVFHSGNFNWAGFRSVLIPGTPNQVTQPYKKNDIDKVIGQVITDIFINPFNPNAPNTANRPRANAFKSIVIFSPNVKEASRLETADERLNEIHAVAKSKKLLYNAYKDKPNPANPLFEKIEITMYRFHNPNAGDEYMNWLRTSDAWYMRHILSTMDVNFTLTNQNGTFERSYYTGGIKWETDSPSIANLNSGNITPQYYLRRDTNLTNPNDYGANYLEGLDQIKIDSAVANDSTGQYQVTVTADRLARIGILWPVGVAEPAWLANQTAIAFHDDRAYLDRDYQQYVIHSSNARTSVWMRIMDLIPNDPLRRLVADSITLGSGYGTFYTAFMYSDEVRYVANSDQPGVVREHPNDVFLKFVNQNTDFQTVGIDFARTVPCPQVVVPLRDVAARFYTPDPVYDSGTMGFPAGTPRPGETTRLLGYIRNDGSQGLTGVEYQIVETIHYIDEEIEDNVTILQQSNLSESVPYMPRVNGVPTLLPGYSYPVDIQWMRPAGDGIDSITLKIEASAFNEDVGANLSSNTHSFVVSNTANPAIDPNLKWAESYSVVGGIGGPHPGAVDDPPSIQIRYGLDRTFKFATGIQIENVLLEQVAVEKQDLQTGAIQLTEVSLYDVSPYTNDYSFEQTIALGSSPETIEFNLKLDPSNSIYETVEDDNELTLGANLSYVYQAVSLGNLRKIDHGRDASGRTWTDFAVDVGRNSAQHQFNRVNIQLYAGDYRATPNLSMLGRLPVMQDAVWTDSDPAVSTKTLILRVPDSLNFEWITAFADPAKALYENPETGRSDNFAVASINWESGVNLHAGLLQVKQQDEAISAISHGGGALLVLDVGYRHFQDLLATYKVRFWNGSPNQPASRLLGEQIVLGHQPQTTLTVTQDWMALLETPGIHKLFAEVDPVSHLAGAGGVNPSREPLSEKQLFDGSDSIKPVLQAGLQSNEAWKISIEAAAGLDSKQTELLGEWNSAYPVSPIIYDKDLPGPLLLRMEAVNTNGFAGDEHLPAIDQGDFIHLEFGRPSAQTARELDNETRTSPTQAGWFGLGRPGITPTIRYTTDTIRGRVLHAVSGTTGTAAAQFIIGDRLTANLNPNDQPFSSASLRQLSFWLRNARPAEPTSILVDINATTGPLTLALYPTEDLRFAPDPQTSPTPTTTGLWGAWMTTSTAHQVSYFTDGQRGKVLRLNSSNSTSAAFSLGDVGTGTGLNLTTYTLPWHELGRRTAALWIRTNGAAQTLDITWLVSTIDNTGVSRERRMHFMGTSGSPGWDGAGDPSIPIGADKNNGEWHYVSLNLQQELEKVTSQETITGVNGIVLAGLDVYADDIELSYREGDLNIPIGTSFGAAKWTPFSFDIQTLLDQTAPGTQLQRVTGLRFAGNDLYLDRLLLARSEADLHGSLDILNSVEVHLPAVPAGQRAVAFWIAHDGSTYYANPLHLMNDPNYGGAGTARVDMGAATAMHDGMGSLAEDDENDNISLAQIEVLDVPTIDLAVESVEVTGGPHRSGEDLQVSVTIRNLLSPHRDGIPLKVWLANGHSTRTQTLAIPWTTGEVRSRTVSLPTLGMTGTVTVWAKIDYNDSNSTNNKKSCQATLINEYMLAIGNPLPAQLHRGENVSFSVQSSANPTTMGTIVLWVANETGAVVASIESSSLVDVQHTSIPTQLNLTWNTQSLPTGSYYIAGQLRVNGRTYAKAEGLPFEIINQYALDMNIWPESFYNSVMLPHNVGDALIHGDLSVPAGYSDLTGITSVTLELYDRNGLANRGYIAEQTAGNGPGQNLAVLQLDDESASNPIGTGRWALQGASPVVLNIPLNSSGATNDTSGNGYNAVNTGASYVAAVGPNGEGAYNFSNNYMTISVGTSITSLSNCTWSVWAKSAIVGSAYADFGLIYDNGFVTSTGGPGLYLSPADDVISLYNGGLGHLAVAGSTLDTAWHHYVVTYDGTKTHFFVDGAEQGTGVTTSGPANYGGIIRLGAQNKSLTRYWNGLISQFHVYNTALSSAQVAMLFNSGGVAPARHLDYAADSTRGKVTHLWTNDGQLTSCTLGDNFAGTINPNASAWHESERKHLSFWMKTNSQEKFLSVYVQVQNAQLQTVERVLSFSTANSLASWVQDMPVFGLGTSLASGMWQNIVLDLQSEMERLLPGERIVEVNGLSLTGTDLWVDNLVLKGTSSHRAIFGPTAGSHASFSQMFRELPVGRYDVQAIARNLDLSSTVTASTWFVMGSEDPLELPAEKLLIDDSSGLVQSFINSAETTLTMANVSSLAMSQSDFMWVANGKRSLPAGNLLLNGDFAQSDADAQHALHWDGGVRSTNLGSTYTMQLKSSNPFIRQQELLPILPETQYTFAIDAAWPSGQNSLIATIEQFGWSESVKIATLELPLARPSSALDSYQHSEINFRTEPVTHFVRVKLTWAGSDPLLLRSVRMNEGSVGISSDTTATSRRINRIENAGFVVDTGVDFSLLRGDIQSMMDNTAGNGLPDGWRSLVNAPVTLILDNVTLPAALTDTGLHASVQLQTSGSLHAAIEQRLIDIKPLTPVLLSQWVLGTGRVLIDEYDANCTTSSTTIAVLAAPYWTRIDQMLIPSAQARYIGLRYEASSSTDSLHLAGLSLVEGIQALDPWSGWVPYREKVAWTLQNDADGPRSAHVRYLSRLGALSYHNLVALTRDADRNGRGDILPGLTVEASIQNSSPQLVSAAAVMDSIESTSLTVTAAQRVQIKFNLGATAFVENVRLLATFAQGTRLTVSGSFDAGLWFPVKEQLLVSGLADQLISIDDTYPIWSVSIEPQFGETFSGMINELELRGCVVSGDGQVVLDRVPPQLTLLHEGPFRTNAQVIPFSGITTDALSGIARIEYRVEETPGDAWTALQTKIDYQPSLPYSWTLSNQNSGQQQLPEGSYTISARSADRAGNFSSSTQIQLIVDYTAPVVAIQTPTSGTWTNQDVQVHWTTTATDLATSVGLAARSALGDPQTTATISVADYDVLTLEGKYKLSVFGTDTAGNDGPTTTTWFAIDKTPPTISVTAQQLMSTASVVATALAADGTGQSGVSAVEIAVDGPSWVPADLQNPILGSYTHTFRNLSEGSHVIWARATDVAGNLSLPTSTTVIVDLTGPLMRIEAPTTGTWTNQILTAHWTSAEDVATSVGQAVWTALGNPHTTATLSVVDGQTLTSEGSYLLAVYGLDVLGNVGLTTFTAFGIDRRAPGLTLSAPALINQTQTTATGTMWDGSGESGIAGVELNVDGEAWQNVTILDVNLGTYGHLLQNLPEGTHVIWAHALDRAGNVSDITSATVVVDLTSPIVRIDAPSSGTWTNQNVSINWSTSATDLASSQGLALWTALGDPFTTASLVVVDGQTLTSEGTYLLSVFGTDIAGNDGPTTLTTFGLDRTLPELTLFAPALTRTTSTTATGTAWDGVGESGLENVELRLNDNPVWTSADNLSIATGEFSHLFTSLDEGVHVIWAKALDRAGNNSAATSVTITVDLTDPVMRIDSPSSGSWTNQSVTVDWSTVAQDLATSHGLAVWSALGDPTTTSSLLVLDGQTLTSEGTYLLSVYGTDFAGNDGPTTFTSFGIDRRLPEITVFAPVLVRVTATTATGIAWDGLGESGLQNVSVRLNENPEWTPAQDLNFMTGDYSHLFTDLGEGSHVIWVQALDHAGNISDITSATVVVDLTSPVVRIDAPSSGTWTNQNVTVDWNALSADLATSTGRALWTALGDPTTTASLMVVDGQTLTSEGTYLLSVYGTDYAGNDGLTTHTFFGIDRHRPDLLVFAPALIRITATTATGTAWDGLGESGLKDVELKLDDAPDWMPAQSLNLLTGEYDHPFTGLAEGVHVIWARAIDNVDNISLPTSSTVLVDLTAPVIDLATYAPDPTGASTLTFTGWTSDTLAGIDRVEVRVDGGTWLLASYDAENGTFSRVVSGLANGSHTAEAQAYDRAGNVSAIDSDTVTVDLNAPQITIVQPSAASLLSGSFTVRADVSDNIAGVATGGVEYLFLQSGQPWQALTLTSGTQMQGSYTKTLDSWTLIEGPVTLSVRAADQVGNNWDTSTTDTNSASVAVSIDNDYPPQRPTGLTASYVSYTQLLLTWNKNTEPDLDFYKIYSREGNGAAIVESTDLIVPSISDDLTTAPYNIYIATVTTETATSNQWNYALKSVDKAGNISTLSETITVPPPDTPDNLRAIGLNGQVQLSWNPVEEGFVKGYHVYRSTQATSASFTLRDTMLGRETVTYTDTAVTNGITYWYYIKAFDGADNTSIRTSPVRAVPDLTPSYVQGSLVLFEDRVETQNSHIDWDFNDLSTSITTRIQLIDNDKVSTVTIDAVLWKHDNSAAGYDVDVAIQGLVGTGTYSGIVIKHNETEDRIIAAHHYDNSPSMDKATRNMPLFRNIAGQGNPQDKAKYRAIITLTLDNPSSNPLLSFDKPPFDVWMNLPSDPNSEYHIFDPFDPEGLYEDNGTVVLNDSQLEGVFLNNGLVLPSISWDPPTNGQRLWIKYPKFVDYAKTYRTNTIKNLTWYE